MRKSQHIYLIELGLAIVVMSSSGTLGRYIDLPPPVTIFGRSLIGALALFIFLKWNKLNMNLGWGRHFRLMLFSSLFMGAHWITYFYALKLSNVAVGMLSLFTYPVITALLEPWLLKVKFRYLDLVLALFAFAGVFLLIPDFNLENNFTLGVTMGLISSLFYSFRNILLKKNISDHSGITLMYYQLLVLSLLLWPILLFFDYSWIDYYYTGKWPALIMLGLFTTALGHTMFVMSFRHFSITTVSIISSLTPLLGIILGWIFLDEIPSFNVIIGGGLILTTVLIESTLSVKKKAT